MQRSSTAAKPPRNPIGFGTAQSLNRSDSRAKPHVFLFATERWRNLSQNAFPPEDGSANFCAERTNLAAFCGGSEIHKLDSRFRGNDSLLDPSA